MSQSSDYTVLVNGREMNPPHPRTRRDDRSHGDSSPTVRVGCVDPIGRRGFITSALALSGGLLVPEWVLDPPKGRSMVSVSRMPDIQLFAIDGIWSKPTGAKSIHVVLVGGGVGNPGTAIVTSYF